MDDDQRRTPDLYGRRPTSRSRGKTIDRIMAHQHAAGRIPGAEAALESRPEGSIAEALTAFHHAWVETKPVTTRRAYERSLAFFARDLAANGPDPSSAIADLPATRLAEHLDWRLANGLDDPGELQRCTVHLARACAWTIEHGGSAPEVDRAWLREQVTARIEHAPPPFHAARVADELRDTSGDAQLLGVEDD